MAQKGLLARHPERDRKCYLCEASCEKLVWHSLHRHIVVRNELLWWCLHADPAKEPAQLQHAS